MCARLCSCWGLDPARRRKPPGHGRAQCAQALLLVDANRTPPRHGPVLPGGLSHGCVPGTGPVWLSRLAARGLRSQAATDTRLRLSRADRVGTKAVAWRLGTRGGVVDRRDAVATAAHKQPEHGVPACVCARACHRVCASYMHPGAHEHTFNM
jgi:hypothetical protein